MIEVVTLQPTSPEIAICATWRVQAFDVLDRSEDEERRSLEAFTRDQEHQVALVARVDGVAAGTCLLVPWEIAPVHQVTPWLAGLYVTPEQRRRGVGEALVRGIEAHARQRGVRRLFLYTTTAVDYYARLGWTADETRDWMGHATTLMVRDLGP